MTRASTFLLALAVVATGCSTKSPVTPTPTPTPGPTTTTTVFTAQLLAANETPPIANAESTGSGAVTITMVVNKDASGTITSATATFVVTLTGFPATTTITIAHIHEGAAGVAGAIKVNTTLASGDVALTAGAGGFTKTGISVPADVAQGMLNTPAGYYFNVHGSLNGGGVIRGQLVKQ